MAAASLSTDDLDRVTATATIVVEVERLHWRIWNGKAKNAQRSIKQIRKVMHVFKGERSQSTKGVASRKLWHALHAIDKFNRTQYPSDVIALVVPWRLRYKLSLRDLPEMFLIRGIVFSHEAVRDWEAKLTPALAEGLRRRRRGKVGKSWYADETYIKVHGHWRYLYRAIDRNGALIDVMFSEHRDMAAAMAFFQSAKTVTEVTPDRVTTDGHDSYPRAIRTSLGEAVKHRTSRYLNNRLEQDHRGIKGRYQPMRGFKCPRSAGRFCRGYDELRSLLRPRSRPHQHMSANNRRLCFLRRTATVMAILEAA